MSTKTTFKRISLVAVATLALGGLSVVPASADGVTTAWTASNSNVTSVSLRSATTTPTANLAVYIMLVEYLPLILLALQQLQVITQLFVPLLPLTQQAVLSQQLVTPTSLVVLSVAHLQPWLAELLQSRCLMVRLALREVCLLEKPCTTTQSLVQLLSQLQP